MSKVTVAFIAWIEQSDHRLPSTLPTIDLCWIAPVLGSDEIGSREMYRGRSMQHVPVHFRSFSFFESGCASNHFE